jgi:hypothetical protein
MRWTARQGGWLSTLYGTEGGAETRSACYGILSHTRLGIGIGGLWENRKDSTFGQWVSTFALITIDAKELVAEIHDRMALILSPLEYTRWLRAGRTVMKSRKFAMSRWRRIGVVVVSVLPCLGFGGYWWVHRLDIANSIELSQIHLCDDAYRSHFPEETVQKACRAAVQAQFLRNAHEADQDWPWILTFCMATLTLAWFTAWIITATLRWIVRSWRHP